MIIARNQLGFLGIGLPGPDIPRPKLRQYMQFSRIGGAIVDRHLQENVFNIGLCVFDLDIEITVVGKDAGVNQLILWFIFAAPPVFFDEPRVGKSGLRILVEHPHVRMGRGTVEVIIEFLDVLTVVAFRIGQPKQPLLEDGIAAVPQRQA